MQGPIAGLGGLLLLLLSIAVLTVVFDRSRFWWQWRQCRGSRARQWQEWISVGGREAAEAIEDWDLAMGFGEPLLQAAAVIAPLLGLIGTVLGLMQVLASLGPGLTLPAGAPLAGYGRVLLATTQGLIVSLIATSALLANQGLRRWQIERLQRQWRRATHPVASPAGGEQP